MPRLFWEIALQQIVPGISFLSSFSCKEWKADRASGPSLPLLQPCYWNSHIPRALLHAASLSSLHAPEILSGWRGREERLTAKEVKSTTRTLPSLALLTGFPLNPGYQSIPTNFLDGSSKWHKRSNVGRGTNHDFCAGKSPHKSLEGKGGVWGRFHSCWFLVSPPLQILLSCCVQPRFEE